MNNIKKICCLLMSIFFVSMKAQPIQVVFDSVGPHGGNLTGTLYIKGKNCGAIIEQPVAVNFPSSMRPQSASLYTGVWGWCGIASIRYILNFNGNNFDKTVPLSDVSSKAKLVIHPTGDSELLPW